MQDFLKSNKTRAALFTIGSLALLLLVFGFGVSVGSRHSLFETRFGTNFYRNFGPERFNTHGVAGEVLEVGTSTLAIKDLRGGVAAVDILPDTLISEDNTAASSTSIIAGDRVIIIGHPTEEGRIQARFIRVFVSSTTLPMPVPGRF